MFCSNCGKEIVDGSKFCSNCGFNIDSIDEKKTILIDKTQYNIFAIVGFIVSSISIFLDFIGLIAITGIIFSIIGLLGSQQKSEKGKRLAISGIIIGGFEVLYQFIFIMTF